MLPPTDQRARINAIGLAALVVWYASLTAAAEPCGRGVRLRSRDFAGAEACRECHPRQYLEWRGSTHAYALVDPVFRACNRKAVAETEGQIGTECLLCHSTIGVRSGELRAPVTGDELPAAIREGITCEICHRAEPPDDASVEANAAFKLTPGSVMLGRLHRPATNRFHTNARSDYLGRSEFCGACHDVNHEGRLVERTFTEWKESEFGGPERGVQCQDCHMLRYSGRAAKNGPFRDELRRHDFPGVTLPFPPFPNRGYMREQIEQFLRRSARLSVVCPNEIAPGAELRLSVVVKNSGAGHNLPAGSMRQMWIEVTVTDTDTDGTQLFRSGHLDSHGDLMDEHSASHFGADPQLVVFSDAHVDAENREVPYWRAERIVESSLGPLEAREEVYRIQVPSSLPENTTLRVRVRLLLRSIAPYSLRAMGLAHLVDELPVWEMNVVATPVRVRTHAIARTTYFVPRDFSDIERAVLTVGDGDTIVVSPGTYELRRPLDFRGKSIRLVGREGAQRTTLRLAGDPSAESASVVLFQSGEDAAAELEGFTLAGGEGTLVAGRRQGGGILISGSSPTIVGNIVTENRARGGDGGGICIVGGAPTLLDNEIRDCGSERGGGLAILGGETDTRSIANNSLQGNVAARGGGLYVGIVGDVRLERFLLAGNRASHEGGAVFADEGVRLTLDHCTIVSNFSSGEFGFLRTDPGLPATVSNSILCFNRPPASVAVLSYCLLGSLASANALDATNMEGDPLFVDVTGFWESRPARLASGGRIAAADEGLEILRTHRWIGGDYRLLPGSPAIDAGDPHVPCERDDTRTDIGALFLEQPLKGFLRGDVDGSGDFSPADLRLILEHLSKGTELPCADAADIDDRGQIDLTDAALLATYLTLAFPMPAAPFPECSIDPTAGEGLGCNEEPAPCREAAIPESSSRHVALPRPYAR